MLTPIIMQNSDDDLPVVRTLTMHNVSYLLSQVLIKITTSITVKYFQENVRII